MTQLSSLLQSFNLAIQMSGQKKKCGLISKLTGERVTCKFTQVAGRPNALIVIQPGTQFLSSRRLAVAFYS